MYQKYLTTRYIYWCLVAWSETSEIIKLQAFVMLLEKGMVLSCIVELDNTCEVYLLIYKVARYLFSQLGH